MMRDEQLLRYSRQIMLPEIDARGQLQLAQSRVLIIGLGGLGSPLSIYLASAGVGVLVLSDHDQVELSNLQRQILYGDGDIGRQKTIVAAERLRALNPEVELIAIDHILEGEVLDEQVAAADVVADASDNFKTRFALNASCVRVGTPLVSAAGIRFEGQVCVFVPTEAESPCYRCLYDEQQSGIEETCTANGVIGPLLGVVGSIQAVEVMKLLMGTGTSLQGRLLLIDLLHMEFHEARLARDPACPVCAIRATV